MLRPPVPSDDSPPNNHGEQQQQLINPLRNNHKLKRKRNEKWSHLRRSSIDLFADKQSGQRRSLADSVLTGSVESVRSVIETWQPYKRQAKVMMEIFDETESLLLDSVNLNSKLLESNLDLDSDCESEIGIRKNKYCQTVASKEGQFWQTIVATVKNPMYIILLITHVSFQWA